MGLEVGTFFINLTFNHKNAEAYVFSINSSTYCSVHGVKFHNNLDLTDNINVNVANLVISMAWQQQITSN